MDSDFTQFPLIAVNEGLMRVGNRKPLFVKLLGTFVANPRGDVLCDALEKKDLSEAAMAAHTVKGMAANLALTRLTKYAEALEGHLKDAKDESAFDQLCPIAANNLFSDTVEEVKSVIATLK